MSGKAVIDMVRGTRRNRIARILRNQPQPPTLPEQLGEVLAASIIAVYRERLAR